MNDAEAEDAHFEMEHHKEAANLGYGVCPKCGESNFEMDDSDPIIEVNNKQDTMTDLGPGENWTEVWKCTECGEEFEEFNGYP